MTARISSKMKHESHIPPSAYPVLLDSFCADSWTLSCNPRVVLKQALSHLVDMW